MTTHRWTSTTRLKRHDTSEEIQPGDLFEPTDGELRHFSQHIEEVEDDETSDSTDGDGAETDDTAADADAEAEPAPDSEDAPFDKDAWFDDHDGFEDRVATVESGDVDAVLDEIEAVERSENVKDAVEARRDDLEE